MARTITVGVGGGSRAQMGLVETRSFDWPELAARLSTPVRDTITTAGFDALDKDGKGARKMAPGFLTGGAYIGPRRSEAALPSRDLVIMDIEKGDADLWGRVVAERRMPASFVWRALVHTTRSHRPDAPRLRVVMPTSRPILPHEYKPLIRHVARLMMPDDAITGLDPASEVWNQAMFWPSCNSDQEFIAFETEGDAIDVDAILAITVETDSKREKNTGRALRRGEEPEAPARAPRAADHSGAVVMSALDDPREGTTVAAAFCRAYSVAQAIDRFLSDIYTPCGDRWTYAGGENEGGLVMLTDTHAYSHHSSDPHHGLALNAFDLVRKHRFGHLDAGAGADTPYPALPSYAAMKDFVMKDTAVTAQLAESPITADDFDLGPDDLLAEFDNEDEGGALPADFNAALLAAAPLAAEAEEGEVIEGDAPDFGGMADNGCSLANLARGGKNGEKIEASIYNVMVILGADPRLAGIVEYDELLASPVATRSFVPGVPGVPGFTVRRAERWTDLHSLAILNFLQAPMGRPGHSGGYGLDVTKDKVAAAVTSAAIKDRFHPIKRILEDEEWDGVERAERLWIDYLGVADTAYHRDTARLWLVAAVARVYEPGHKFDFVPVLFSGQGGRKSTMAEILGMGFSGALKSGDFRDKARYVEATVGKWIVEIPEMAASRGATQEEIKSFISSTKETVRLSYKHFPEDYAARHVMMGTVNKSTFLEDATGGRRYWPLQVRVAEIDTDRLIDEVGQIWAEALVIYRRMRAEHTGTLPLYLQGEAAKTALALQERARVIDDEDTLRDEIMSWIETGKADGDLDVDGVGYYRRFAAAEAFAGVSGKDARDFGASGLTKLYGRALDMIPYLSRVPGATLNRRLGGKQRQFEIDVEAFAAHVRGGDAEMEAADKADPIAA